MVVLVVERVTPGLRGTLTRWLSEVQVGVFVGNVSARIREALWLFVESRKRLGACVLIFQAQNEQGYAVHVSGDTSRELVDFDGLVLFSKRQAQGVPVEIERLAFEAQIDPRTVKRFLAGQPVRPNLKARIEAAKNKLQGDE